MPERAILTGLNACLLLFVPEICLIKLTKQYALAQVAANSTAPRPKRRYIVLGCGRHSFRFGPAAKPGVSALPFDALLQLSELVPMITRTKYSSITISWRIGKATTRKWGRSQPGYNPIWLDEWSARSLDTDGSCQPPRPPQMPTAYRGFLLWLGCPCHEQPTTKPGIVEAYQARDATASATLFSMLNRRSNFVTAKIS